MIDVPFYPSSPPGYRKADASPVGSAATSTRRKADPTEDYVSAPRGYPGKVPRVLDPIADDVMRREGPYIYQAMDLDPACRAAKEALILSVLAGGMDLAPVVKPKAGAKTLTAEEQRAGDMVDFCWRQAERVDDFESILRDLLEATRDGVRLARPVLEPAVGGKDSGKLVLKALTVKPNDLWRFVVDEFWNVEEVEFRDVGSTEKVRYPADAFLWLTWDRRDNNPYGQSVYRAANEWWNLKYMALPEYHLYLHQFASGKLVGTTAAGETDREPEDAAGNSIPGAAKISPQKSMRDHLSYAANGGIVVIPAGAKVEVHWPSGGGEPFLAGFDACDKQITTAILLQSRATREAEHGSKADSQTGQDILGMKVERGRKALAAVVRTLWRRIIAINFGDEVAAESTPLVTFGQADTQDRPALWGAASGLKSSGYLGESQIQELDQMIGLPTRDMEADAKKAEEAAQKAMERQQAMNPPPGGVAGDGEDRGEDVVKEKE